VVVIPAFKAEDAEVYALDVVVIVEPKFQRISITKRECSSRSWATGTFLGVGGPSKKGSPANIGPRRCEKSDIFEIERTVIDREPSRTASDRGTSCTYQRGTVWNLKVPPA
jgi:hypothetical protein